MTIPVELIGLAAGVLTTIAYVPQALKTWRTQQAGDLSLPMLLMLNSGIVLWLAYGVLLGSPGLIGANAVTLSLAASILWVKIRRG